MSLWSFRLVLGLASLGFSLPSVAQNATLDDTASTHVHATVLLTSGAAQYRQGDLIEVSIRFETDRTGNFELDASQTSSRWDTETTEEFHVVPPDQAVDPLAEYVFPFLGNLRRFSNSHQFSAAAPLPGTLTLP